MFFDGSLNQKEVEIYLASAYKKFCAGTDFINLSSNEKSAVNQMAGKDARADEILKK